MFNWKQVDSDVIGINRIQKNSRIFPRNHEYFLLTNVQSKYTFKKCYLMYSRKLLILEISTKTIISWRQLNIQICFQFISSTKVSNAIFGVAICTLAMLTLAALTYADFSMLKFGYELTLVWWKLTSYLWKLGT